MSASAKIKKIFLAIVITLATFAPVSIHASSLSLNFSSLNNVIISGTDLGPLTGSFKYDPNDYDLLDPYNGIYRLSSDASSSLQLTFGTTTVSTDKHLNAALRNLKFLSSGNTYEDVLFGWRFESENMDSTPYIANLLLREQVSASNPDPALIQSYGAPGPETVDFSGDFDATLLLGRYYTIPGLPEIGGAAFSEVRIVLDKSSFAFQVAPPPPPPDPTVPVSSSPIHGLRLTTYNVSNSLSGGSLSQSTTVGFDPSSPTYVITHGWQPEGDYSDPDWDFSLQPRQSGLNETLESIKSRLLSEATDANGKPLMANVILAEWEGAYTGGAIYEALGDEKIYLNSSLARSNADYAGLLLGVALKEELGDNYAQDLHFIGHSFGTIVNGLATKYLSRTGWFENEEQTVQFTALDAPTNRDLFAPNFNEDWFSTNLATEIRYFDNYYGSGLAAFGERYTGNFNQEVGFDHGEVWSTFYNNLIVEGAGVDAGGPSLLVDDWVTPLLNTIPADENFIPRLFGSEEKRWDTSDVVFENLINAEALEFATFTFYECDGSWWNVLSNKVCGTKTSTYTFDGVLIEERSPVAFSQFIHFSDDARYLAFDWIVSSGGDGDWFSLFFDDQLIWSMGIDPLFEGIFNRAYLDISAFSGASGDLIFSLSSRGDANAGFYIGDLTILKEGNSVPEPLSLALVVFGLAMIALRRNKSKED